MAIGLDCWARCEQCGRDFTIGCVVPCPLSVYVAALKAAACPNCGAHKGLSAYEPGRSPSRRKDLEQL